VFKTTKGSLHLVACNFTHNFVDIKPVASIVVAMCFIKFVGMSSGIKGVLCKLSSVSDDCIFCAAMRNKKYVYYLWMISSVCLVHEMGWLGC